MIIVDIFLWLIFSFFSFFVLYFLIFDLGAICFKPKVFPNSLKQGKFLVLIPSYKEDAVILNTASEAIKQNYPQHLYEVCIIADKLKPETIAKLQQMPLKVVEVFFETSTKIKSINTVLSQLDNNYEYVMILDADNIMESDCLQKFNNAFQSGLKAVQGHRTAKNKNTSFAMMDGLTEEINNNIFRSGHRALGLSSALIGSGMAFQIDFFKEVISTITVSWEDKQIEFNILKNRVLIEYLKDVFIYDEKVQNAEVFASQRSRWVAGQLHSLKNYTPEGIRQLLKGNFDYFNKLIQTCIPTRVIMLGLIPMLGVITFFLPVALPFYNWFILWALYILSIFMAIPGKMYNKELLKAILQVPKAFVFMVLALLKVGKAKKSFVHTPHSHVN